jgi:hypothetical protein
MLGKHSMKPHNTKLQSCALDKGVPYAADLTEMLKLRKL